MDSSCSMRSARRLMPSIDEGRRANSSDMLDAPRPLVPASPVNRCPGRKVDQSRMSSLGSADDGFALTGGRLLPRASQQLYTAPRRGAKCRQLRHGGGAGTNAVSWCASSRHAVLVVGPLPVVEDLKEALGVRHPRIQPLVDVAWPDRDDAAIVARCGDFIWWFVGDGRE